MSTMFGVLNRFISRLDAAPLDEQQSSVNGAYGFQVLRNANLEVPLEPWFDFIIGINGRTIVSLILFFFSMLAIIALPSGSMSPDSADVWEEALVAVIGLSTVFQLSTAERRISKSYTRHRYGDFRIRRQKQETQDVTVAN